ncbi:MAG: CDP-diacylglycerol--glycerol-3-phosphate 3-phosphatidyltransferase [Actinomycetota bacterium]
MNVPNWITVGRILLVPVFLVFAYRDSDASAIAAFGVFVVASASDRLDGYLARRHDLVSRAGAFLDPLADKLLVGAALVVLVDTRSFPLWAALIIGVREVAVLVLRTTIVSSGGVLPASPAAKIKTVVQLGMVSWWLLPWDDVFWAHWLWLGAALVTTLWSGVEYFGRAERVKEVAP